MNATLETVPVTRPEHLNIADLKPGDRVGVSGRRDYQDGYGTLATKDRYGRITLEDGRLFNKRGDEILAPCQTYCAEARLVPAWIIDARLARKAEQKARNKRMASLKDRLDAILAGKKNGYGDYCSDLTAEEKAELITLIQAS
jgi:hypothetical protein